VQSRHLPGPPSQSLPSDRPLFISKAKAASLLSVSPWTIDCLRDDGEIEAINVRGGVMVLVSSLEAYIERQLDESGRIRVWKRSRPRLDPPDQ
jgi:hypothetical protein